MSILKLAPACKDYLWGGTKLITDYGKRYDGARLAETWELSGHPDGPSVLTSGPDAGKTLAEYLAAHPGALGEHGRKFAELPVLIKLIDAAKDLSIQVHPDDAYARAHEGQNGKTEMWYVLSAEPDAFLYCGFSRDISRDELKRRIADNTLPEVLRRVNVKAGDTVERGELLFETVTGTLDGLYAPDRQVVSDAAGVIATVDAGNGTSVEKDAKIATIYPNDAMQIKMVISEADLMDVTVGGKAEIEFNWDADSGRRFEGTISSISYLSEKQSDSAASQSAQYVAYVDFTPDETVRIGMTVIVYVE